MLYRDDEKRTSMRLSPSMIDELQYRMERERSVYASGDEGVNALCKLICSAGIFDKIDPTDVAAMGARNFAIDLLDSLGLVTEESLPDLVRFMLNSPLPFRYEENNDQ